MATRHASSTISGQLDYFGARYYMPALGRWTTMDPLADSFPAGNGYNYVEGNPITSVNVGGLGPCDALFDLESPGEWLECMEEKFEEEDRERAEERAREEERAQYIRSCGSAVGTFGASAITDYAGGTLIRGGAKLTVRGAQWLRTARRLQQIENAAPATRQAARTLGIAGHFGSQVGQTAVAGGVAVQMPSPGPDPDTGVIWDAIPVAGSMYRGGVAVRTCFFPG